MTGTSTEYPWKFQRLGGIDQVILQNAQDIMHLDELDPKLWVALSCPASGLELDEKTLSLLDSDNDDRIRLPDIVEAIKWLKTRLLELDSLTEYANELPLSAINSENANGQRLIATAKAILANIGKNDQQSISFEDLKESTLVNNSNLFNGDGIVPVSNKIDPELQTFIKDALSVMGGVKDASGLDGIDNRIATAFKQSLEEWQNWYQNVSTVTTPLGNDTAEAWQLVLELKDKINDYFLRTELASYAPQAEKALNVDEKYIVPMDNGLLAQSALAELPLSKIEANKELSLTNGLNPVWRDKVLRLITLVNPFLNSQSSLSLADWQNIQKLLSPYSIVVSSKPKLVKVETTIAPKMTIDKLGEDRVNALLNSNLFDEFAMLAEKDSKTPAAASDIADVEKLVMYHKHLFRLLINFVSFYDFFDLDKRRAAFQAGQLFIDGRCCTLCIGVNDIAKHTALANYCELFLMYCECTRKSPPINGSQQKCTIVAAMTAGDADFLLEGRNGVFIDNDGHDWDAKIVKIISKPISISQAIWDPYKRIGRFITEQINKWATAKDSAMVNSATQITQTTEPAKFDIAKSMGIFAAIGLALGALGTAVASIASSLFQLNWWQLPFVFIGIFLIISGPSVILAWIKLRQRTIGPLLEASGWAINGKIKINLFLGSQLTSKAELPQNASRSLIDPMKKNHHKFWLIFFFAIIIAIAAVGGGLWHAGYFDHNTKPVTSKVVEANGEIKTALPPQSQ